MTPIERASAVLALSLSLFAAPAHSAEWTQFKSRQFGFSIAFPQHLIIDEQSRPAEGQYALQGDASLIFSVDKLNGEPLRPFLNRNLLQGVNVTYTQQKGPWMAYSGYVGPYIVYGRSHVSCGGRFAHTFLIRYPRSERKTYDRVVDRLSHSIRVDPAYVERNCSLHPMG